MPVSETPRGLDKALIHRCGHYRHDRETLACRGAKLVPNGLICLASALAFHEFTDRAPARIWVAIGPREWRPRITHPPIEIVRFGPKLFEGGIQRHDIECVPVGVYSPAKTISDLSIMRSGNSVRTDRK